MNIIKTAEPSKKAQPLTNRAVNLISLILAICSLYLILFGKIKASIFFASIAMMLIPFLRIVNSLLSRVSKFAEETKVHNKKMTEHLQKLEEGYVEIDGIFQKKDSMIHQLCDTVEDAVEIIQYLKDEVKPLKIKIKNKHNVKMTLIEAEKIQIDYEGKVQYATPSDMGFVDRRKNPSRDWTEYITLNSQCSGNVPFFILLGDYMDNPDKYYKQVERFLKRLSTFLGVTFEKGKDYTYKNGIFLWKSIMWSDAFTPHQELLAIQEMIDNYSAGKDMRFLNKLRNGEINLKTGEQVDPDSLDPDSKLAPIIIYEPNRSAVEMEDEANDYKEADSYSFGED